MAAAFTQDTNRFDRRASLPSDARKKITNGTAIDIIAALAGVSLRVERSSLAVPDLSCVEAEAVAALAVRTRMTGPCQRAFSIAAEPMPASLAEAVRGARARAAVSNGRVLGLARIAFKVLERAGIAGIAFKGPFQHRQVHGDPFFCRSGDLDLLVARADFMEALYAFERAGFTRREGTSSWWTTALGEVHLTHPEGGVIDLHHRLQQPGCPPPRDLARFLDAAGRETIGGVTIAFPALPETVLICALNFTKEFAHRKASARYAYDVAAGLLAVAATGGEAAFARLAAEQGLSGTVGFAAALAGRMFGIELPLARRELPDWASREAVLAMAFDPEGTATSWPRRRAVLWALCSDRGTARRAAQFAREQTRIIASEALRRSASGTAKEP